MKRGTSHFFAAAVSFMLFVEVFSLGRAVWSVPPEAFDFRQLYAAGWMVRSGEAHHLYDLGAVEEIQNRVVSQHTGALPFNHLAYEAVLLAPLTFLPFRAAYYAMLFLNLCLLFLCYLLVVKHFRFLRRTWKFLPEAIFLCFLPFAFALVQGQDSILLSFFLLLTSLALRSRKDGLAGIFLALGLFKFQFILPIAVLYLVWRQWAFIRGFLCGAAVLSLVSLAVVGVRPTWAYGKDLLSMSVGLSQQTQNVYGIHPLAMPNLRGLVAAITGSASGMIWILTTSLIALCLAARKRGSFATAVIFAVLVSFHCLYHDLSLLSVPVAAVLADQFSSARVRLAAFTMLLAPSVIYGFGLGLWITSLPLVALFLSLVFVQVNLPSSAGTRVGYVEPS